MQQSPRRELKLLQSLTPYLMPLPETKADPLLHLIYHRVVPEDSTYTYALSARKFGEHLSTIRDLRPATSYPCKITFDDGSQTQFRHAFPMLQNFGLTAIFFITAGWVGVNEGTMTDAEVREIFEAGHTIGAHGLTHKLLTQCSTSELTEELVVSKQKLEQIIGRQVTHLSLPGGRYNQRVLERCGECGYTRVFTSDPGSYPGHINGVELVGRLNVLNTLSADGLLRLVDPNSGDLRRAMRKAALRRVARRIVGDRLYQNLWTIAARPKRSF